LQTFCIVARALGEEYHILVQLKTLQYKTREIRENYNLDTKDMNDKLAIIIRDEETHRKLLAKMKKILVGKEKQTEDIAPAFKYKNPDAWSRSMPDSVYENVH
jgi:hypothetical protein